MHGKKETHTRAPENGNTHTYHHHHRRGGRVILTVSILHAFFTGEAFLVVVANLP